MQNFDDLPETLSLALSNKGYSKLTPVQEAVSEEAVQGKDLLVSAQTGSGKTVGFGLAMAGDILNADDRFGPAASPLAVVIAPTRELALQVRREFDWLYEEAGIVTASAVGGMDARTERRALERGAHVVVATPGRLRDHAARGVIDLSDLSVVVLDEADEMLDMGFAEDLEFILDQTPETRRTLMFSATVPRGIAKLAQTYQKPDAERLNVGSAEAQHSDISYSALTVAPSDIEKSIINLLLFHDAQTAIVFANTRAMVARLAAKLSNRGFAVVSLSGELSQAERTNAMQALRDGRAHVCVATDVAARGIDLPGLELVIHADLPQNAEALLHRSGRTGRAGRKGSSVLIVPGRQRSKAQRLLKFAKLEAKWEAPPSAEVVQARQEERIIGNPALDAQATQEETEFAQKLLAGRSPEQIAAAYLRLFRERTSAPEILGAAPEPGKKKPTDHTDFGPSTWFSLSLGRKDRAEPRWLLPMLCRNGGLAKDAIGAIRVQYQETFVEISNAAVDGLKRELGPELALEQGAKLSELAGVPDFEASPKGPPADGGRAPEGKAPRKPRSDGLKGGHGPKRDTAPKREPGDAPAHKGKSKRVWSDPEPRETSKGKGPRPGQGKDQGKDNGKDQGKKHGKSKYKDKPKHEKAARDGRPDHRTDKRSEARTTKPKGPASDKKPRSPKGAQDPSKPLGARKARHKSKGPKTQSKPQSKSKGKGGESRPFRKPPKRG